MSDERERVRRVLGEIRSAPRRAAVVDPSGFRGNRIADTRTFHQAVAGFRRDYFSAQPEDLGSALTAMRSGVAYLAGTTVPMLGSAFARRDDSLVVPAAILRGPLPADLLATYLTAAEVLGQPLDLDVAIEVTRGRDLAATLIVCARLLSRLEARAVEPARDLEIARRLRQPYRARAEVAIRSGRVLVGAQAMMIAAKLALLHARPKPVAHPEGGEWLVVAGLAIQTSLGRAATPTGASVPGIVGDAGAVAELVRTQVFTNRVAPVMLLAQAQRRWRDLPDRERGRSDHVDLEASFVAATGAHLDDFVALGLRIWMLADGGRYAFTLADLGLRISRRRLDRALRLLAAPPHVLRSEIRTEEATYGAAWSFDALRRFPVVRLHDGRFVALSARLALERVFSVVRYDVELNLRAAGRDGDADRAMNFWRSMCELDAFDSLATMAPATGPLQRLYREPELQAAFARGGKKGATAKSADAAIEYPGAWLVAEVTSSALTRTAAVGGSVAALVADLAKIEAKARQLQTTMDALRADDTRLTGRLAPGGRRFVPLLVMAEGFPVNAATTTALRAQLAAKGILAAPDIAPLHVIDAEELAMAESLVEQGTSLLDLLDGHARGNFRAMSLRDYILVERKATPGLPKRLQDAYERAWAPIFAAVPTSPTT